MQYTARTELGAAGGQVMYKDEGSWIELDRIRDAYINPTVAVAPEFERAPSL
jgi:hypothetical protein